MEIELTVSEAGARTIAFLEPVGGCWLLVACEDGSRNQQATNNRQPEGRAALATSTGIFGYPLDRCARIMIEAVTRFAPRARSLRKVTFCLFGADAMREFTAALGEIRS